MRTTARYGKCGTMICMGVSLALVCPPATGQASPLCPQPQKLTLLPGAKPLDVSRGYRLNIASPNAAPVVHAAAQLQAAITKAYSITPADDGPASITIGTLGDAKLSAESMKMPGPLPAEGYILLVNNGNALVLGKDARGAAYGCQTLIQLLQAGKPVAAQRITDWPDTAYRMSYVGGGDTLTDRVRRLIDMAAHYKLNMLVFENGAYFQLEDEKIAVGVKEVFDYCRAVGIEPIPELQSFGWSGSVLNLDPLCIEARPWKDRQYVFGSDDMAVFVSGAGVGPDVKNADLEQGDGNNFTGWQQDDAGETIFEGEGADGGRALRITRTTSGTSRIYQTFPCVPNQRYTLGVDIKAQPGKDFCAYYEVYYGTTGVYAPSGAITDGKGADWHTKTVLLDPGPSTTMTLYLRVQNGTGTAWFDNVTCRQVQFSPMINIVRTRDLPFEVKSPDGVTLYTEGADYKLLPGDKLKYPFKDTVKPWNIQRLRDGRIKPGGKVSVSYHSAPAGTTGTYCPSEPRTRTIMKRSIQQTVKILKPRFVHIGHDESRLINSDDRCKRRGMKAYEIFADDVRRLYGYARSVDPSITLMMWADALAVTDGTLHNVEAGMIDVAHRFNEKCTIEQMAKLIPTDIVLNGWKYHTGNSRIAIDARIDELHELLMTRARVGYAITGSPWYGLVNTYCWGKAIQRARRNSDRPLGMFLTTWNDHWETLPLTSNLMWTLDSPSYKDVQDAAELKLELTEWIGQFPTDRSKP